MNIELTASDSRILRLALVASIAQLDELIASARKYGWLDTIAENEAERNAAVVLLERLRDVA